MWPNLIFKIDLILLNILKKNDDLNLKLEKKIKFHLNINSTAM